MSEYEEIKDQIQAMSEAMVYLIQDTMMLERRLETHEKYLQNFPSPTYTSNECKKTIVRELKFLLQYTRAGSNIKDLVLDDREEYVTIVFENGTKRVPVMGDSGIGLIQDVIKYLLK